MKPDIHPDYVECTVRCSCGNTFKTRSTKPELVVDLCNECYPFFTGQQKFVDTGGRVQRFSNKFGSAADQLKERKAAEKAAKQAAAAEKAAKAAEERAAKQAAKEERAKKYAEKAAREAEKAEQEAAAAEDEAKEEEGVSEVAEAAAEAAETEQATEEAAVEESAE